MFLLPNLLNSLSFKLCLILEKFERKYEKKNIKKRWIEKKIKKNKK